MKPCASSPARRRRLLIIDETHTICTGPGGYTAAHGLQPDMLTLGKPIASGVPAAVYGFSEEVNQRFMDKLELDDADVGGVGGTLAGNALSVAAIHATLEQVLTPTAYEKTLRLGDHFEAGVTSIIRQWELPWIVKRLGGRVEYWFRPSPPHNGGEAAAAIDFELDQYMHLLPSTGES